MVAHALKFSRDNKGKDTVLEVAMTKLSNREYVISASLADPIQDIWSFLYSIGKWAEAHVQ